MNLTQKAGRKRAEEKQWIEDSFCAALLRFQRFCEANQRSFRQELAKLVDEKVGYVHPPQPPPDDRLPTPKQIQAAAASKARWDKQRRTTTTS